MVITLNKESSFECKYSQDLLGSGTLKGKYSINKETIHLFVAKDTSEQNSYFKTYTSADSKLSVKVFIFFANKDQESFGGYIILNDTARLKLDLNGHTNFRKFELGQLE